ncbi:hypothetical protein L6452_37967 [Arctium lappa]|uniref:Uncharacterized protein n=1 Tax=Arctium lappa TaxID=4217 RepID=A0ACB8Y4F1_ARCLA|nr:hypothetical protein L6452_37967 [Arctium lappa]
MEPVTKEESIICNETLTDNFRLCTGFFVASRFVKQSHRVSIYSNQWRSLSLIRRSSRNGSKSSRGPKVTGKSVSRKTGGGRRVLILVLGESLKASLLCPTLVTAQIRRPATFYQMVSRSL